MDTYRRSGIVTGILFIAATAAGTLCLFTQGPVNAPDYLTQISANEPRVLVGALLVFIMGWAGALEVSKPAASKFTRKLLRRGYLLKEKQAGNAKGVSFSLSPKGRRAEQAHERFTRKVFGPLQAVESGLSASDRRVIRSFLEAIGRASTW